VRESDVRTIAQAIELARLVGQNGVLHLHAHFATAPTTVARLAASLANIPYTFTAHTEDLISVEADEIDLEAKIRDASGTITVNDFSLEYIQQAFGSAAQRVERVYNGLRTEALPFTSPASRARLIVAVGPLEETSGFEFLIKAVAKSIGRGQHVLCHIVGSGSLEIELDALIVENNLRDSVKLMVTATPDDVLSEIRNAALLAAPCVVAEDGSTGGVPGVVLEAMTAGTPVISTDVGGIPEVIVDGQTGIQVPQRDVDALSSALERLLSDEVLRVRIALKARVLVESEFNIHRNAERMRSFFGPSRGDGSMSDVEPAIATNGRADDRHESDEREDESAPSDIDEAEFNEELESAESAASI
jgi:colanic acid/amylovoran biosynthesis glycosyltransferase